MRSGLIIILFCLVLGVHAYAQVNIEKMRLGGQSSSFNMSLNFQSVDGNVGYVANAADFRWDHKTAGWDWFVMGNSASRVAEGETISSHGFVHWRASTPLSESKRFELFSQFESRPFSKLNRRELFGLGVRYAISLPGVFPFAVGIGIMTEHEDHQDGEENTLRSTNYLSLSHSVGTGATVRATAYYQPSTADLNDYRLITDAELAIKVSQTVYWKSSMVMRFDSNPEPNVRKRDMEVRQGIGLTL